MKSLFRIVLFLLLGSIAVAQTIEMREHREAEMKRHARLAKRAQFVPASMENYDVTHYRLDIRLPKDAGLNFRGSVVMTLRSTADNLSSIDVHLGSNAVMDSVLVRGQRLTPAQFTHTDDVVTIPLPSPLNAGEELALTMYYNASYGGSGMSVREVTNVDLNKQIISIASQSEPYDARTWWPCKDDPNDKADSVDILVTVSEEMYPVSNGLVQSDVNNGDGTRTVHWKSLYPIVTYLVSVAAAEYNYRALEFTHTGHTMPVGSWWYGMRSNDMAAYEQDMLTGLQVYSDLFIPYPYLKEKYGMAEYEWGGAMEHQTVSSMGFYSTDVVVHELMHQWFGDKVTCASFHHIWLNEGWATYGEALYFEALGGLEALKMSMAQAAYFGPGTIYVSDPTDFSRIFSGSLSYNKASWVVHMLRHVVGDEVFFRATRKYLGGEERETYRSVVTSEFQEFFEQESGKDLDAFFQNWIYGEYYPTYQFEWSDTPVGQTHELALTIEQLYLPQRQLFIMPIDVYVRFKDGSDTTIVVNNDQAVQQWTFVLDREVDLVRLDPDNWILKRVVEKFSNPTFDKGILVVNGVDWDEDAYRDDLTTAFADSVYSGGKPYTFWDLFPNPAAGYPAGVPEPIGSGAIPAKTLGEYCTVVWLGNAYNGDEAHWANTSMMEYIRAGGNLVLITRYGQQFIGNEMRQFLGITWNGSYATVRECRAALPSLTDMEFTGDQNLLNPFTTTLSRAENALLFTETRSTGETWGIGVWGKPMQVGEKMSGHMMFLSLRPYRINPLQLKTNMTAMLNELPCVPVVGNDATPGVPDGMQLSAVYPNPATADAQRAVRVSLRNAGTVTLRVYDALGREVREAFNGSLAAGEYTMQLPLSGLAAGMYNVLLSDGTRTASTRVMIMR